MTNNETTELARLLNHRAESIVVTPDLSTALDASPPSLGRPEPRRRWLAVAALLFVAGGAGLLLAKRTFNDNIQVVVSDPSAAPLTEFAGATFDGEVIVWLDVDVTDQQVEAVANRLAAASGVGTAVYKGRDATYEEFVAYFTDEPEILEGVEPEHLPTSFLVSTSSEASEIARLLEDLGGVQGVEGASE